MCVRVICNVVAYKEILNEMFKKYRKGVQSYLQLQLFVLMLEMSQKHHNSVEPFVQVRVFCFDVNM